MVRSNPSSHSVLHDLFSHGFAAEREQLFELVSRHLGGPVLAAADDVFGEGSFTRDQHIDALFQGSDADELVYLYVTLLPDAKGSIGGLVLDCRVPPAIEVKHVVGGCEVEADAAGLQ